MSIGLIREAKGGHVPPVAPPPPIRLSKHANMHSRPRPMLAYRRGSRIFERGGGSRRRYRIFHKHPPPWTLSM